MAGATSPKFLKPISARTLGSSGGRVMMEAVIIGRPIPVITWYKNGLVISKDERHLMRYEERGNCSLTLLNVGEVDEGEYECRARNRLGQVSCFGQLYVNDVSALESGVKQMGLRHPSSFNSSPSSSSKNDAQTTDVDDATDGSEGHSGLFILIDEGSQDENSADEMGRKEPLSASEQIESIIEDLRLRDGSLNFSLSKQQQNDGSMKADPTSSFARERYSGGSSTSGNNGSGGSKPSFKVFSKR